MLLTSWHRGDELEVKKETHILKHGRWVDLFCVTTLITREVDFGGRKEGELWGEEVMISISKKGRKSINYSLKANKREQEKGSEWNINNQGSVGNTILDLAFVMFSCV